MGQGSNKQQTEAGTDAVSAALALLDELPQLHAAVYQLFEALSDDDTDRQQLAGILDQCPSLAAKLVGLANSAYFSRARWQRRSIKNSARHIMSLEPHC